jgi:hypothetical protein
MNIPSTTIQPPDIIRNARNGEPEQIRVQKSFVINSLNPIYIDDPLQRKVIARFQRFPNSITLWEGASYDSIGDWTSVQAESRILEVLSPLKETLESLFVTRF